jgi:hypothetical protein
MGTVLNSLPGVPAFEKAGDAVLIHIIMSVALMSLLTFILVGFKK